MPERGKKHMIKKKGENRIVKTTDTRLVIEDNTIYEIDLNCQKKRKRREEEQDRRDRKKGRKR